MHLIFTSMKCFQSLVVVLEVRTSFFVPVFVCCLLRAFVSTLCQKLLGVFLYETLKLETMSNKSNFFLCVCWKVVRKRRSGKSKCTFEVWNWNKNLKKNKTRKLKSQKMWSSCNCFVFIGKLKNIVRTSLKNLLHRFIQVFLFLCFFPV